MTHAYNFPAEGLTNLFPHVDSRLQSELPFSPPESQEATATVPTAGGSDSFPNQDRLVELTEIFLDHFDAFLPFLHRASFLENIRSGELPQRAPALIYASLAISAGSHSDSTVRAQQEAWYCKAKALYAETAHDPQQPLQVIQAAACIIFRALMCRDYSVAWLVMGKAWRQAVALGFHRLDGDGIRSPGQAPEPTSLREKEEQSRTMWTLFILDRGMCFPLGLPHAIDDRQFMANLPLNDGVFQGISPVVRLLAPYFTFSSNTDDIQFIESATAKPFTRNFTKLVTSIQADPNDTSPDLLRFIVVSYVLLGRIVEHIQSPYASTDRDEYESEFQALDMDLIRIRLSIPRSASFLPAATADNFKHVVWLNAVINISTILLHARPIQAQATTSDQEFTRNGADVSQDPKPTHWAHCLTAARNTVGIVKDASRVSMETLFNPHTSVSFYLAGRILALELLETKFANATNPQQSASQQQQRDSESLRTEIDILLLLFDRLAEVFPDLGSKFKTGLLNQLDQDAESVRQIKAEGVKGFLGKCPGWSSRAKEYRQSL